MVVLAGLQVAAVPVNAARESTGSSPLGPGVRPMAALAAASGA